MSKTPAEILAELQAQGNLGQWQPVQGPISPARMQQTQESLLRLRGLLEQLVKRDQDTVLHLREQLARLKHGGGS